MTRFEAGKTYQGRFICDYDSKILLTVVSRTAYTMKALIDRDPVKTLRIGEFMDSEMVRPLGRYSMAPVISAEKVI